MSEVWSAIMVRDVIYNMAEFAARTCEGWDNNEDWDYTTENPEITDAEMEQIVPGITQQVTKTVARHIPSGQMHLAIYAQARELAQTAVNEMDPEDQVAIINAARKKVHKARGQEGERVNDKTKYIRRSGGRDPRCGNDPPPKIQNAEGAAKCLKPRKSRNQPRRPERQHPSRTSPTTTGNTGRKTTGTA